MRPGREMDELVSKKFMGWKWGKDNCPICGWKFAKTASDGCVPDNCCYRGDDIKKFGNAIDRHREYSTSAMYGIYVWEKLALRGYSVSVCHGPAKIFGVTYSVDAVKERESIWDRPQECYSMPHGVCIVALVLAGVLDK